MEERMKVDTCDLNEAPDWQTWFAELEAISEALDDYGLDAEAVVEVERQCISAANAGDGVQVYFYGEATETPTTSTGGGSYYYWPRRGNAWVDSNTQCVGEREKARRPGDLIYETWIRITLVSAERLAAEAHNPLGLSISTGVYGTGGPLLSGWVVDNHFFWTAQEAAQAAGITVTGLKAAARTPLAKIVADGSIAHVCVRVKDGQDYRVEIPEDWLKAGRIALSHWAVHYAGHGNLAGAELAHWAGVAAAQQGKEVGEAVDICQLLRIVDDYLTPRSGRLSQAETRHLVRAARKAGQ